MRVRAHYYQQFDADPALEVPAEGYGGWKSDVISIAREHTALAVMHAWDTGSPDEFPGWRRAVEYIPRAETICREVFPPLLSAARETGFRVFHIVSAGSYCQHLPGFARARELSGPPPDPAAHVPTDPVLDELRRFRRERVFVGAHNEEDVRRGFDRLDFAPDARPEGDEPVCESTEQLAAVCRAEGVNHLVYAGFAINWCILLSPGGMADMSRHGVMCSAIREAVTAVENRETARDEVCKQIALWRVALAFGFVFDLNDFLTAVREGG